MSDTFWTWSTKYEPDDNLFYVRLDRMEVGSCEVLGSLDYGRFKTFLEAQAYIDTLPEPEDAAREEGKCFA